MGKRSRRLRERAAQPPRAVSSEPDDGGRGVAGPSDGEGPDPVVEAGTRPLQSIDVDQAPSSGTPTAAGEPASGLEDLADRIDALTQELTKVRSEANQTGDFVRQMSRTLGEGSDAIRAQAMAEANEALMRAHSAVALARVDAESKGEAALAEVIRRIESDIDAELAFVGITPLVPASGDDIDTRLMRTQGAIPDGIDPTTARRSVERVIACGYLVGDRRILPTVAVRWEPRDGGESPADA